MSNDTKAAMIEPTKAQDFGEPWEIGRDADANEYILRDRREFFARSGDWVGNEIRLRRSVACVNACAGMSDPASEIRRLRAVEKAADALADSCQDTWNTNADGDEEGGQEFSEEALAAYRTARAAPPDRRE